MPTVLSNNTVKPCERINVRCMSLIHANGETSARNGGGNTVPSLRGNSFEGVTTSRETYCKGEIPLWEAQGILLLRMKR